MLGKKSNTLTKEAIAEKGESGEKALNAWLLANKLPYLYVAQSPETFATLFPGAVKRPDFLILFESIGLIAVDAKNYTLSRGVYTLGLEKELKKVLAFERLFRLPVWYAYKGHDAEGDCWHWISALRALEVGDVRTNTGEDTQFLAIKLEHFCTIRTNADLGAIYVNRLAGAGKIAADAIATAKAG